MASHQLASDQGSQPYKRTELVDGQPTELTCVDIGGQTFEIHGSFPKTAILADEWFQDLERPDEVVGELSRHADLLSFWQRLPHTESAHTFYMEPESIAVLEIESYEDWWKNKIKSRIRTSIRKAGKNGLVVSEVPFDDKFVQGMTAIFNETPIRQGREFWHYGKDFDTVKAQFGRYAHRETMIGAYVNDEMIGFVMLGDAGPFALLGQILSSVRHRDKVPNNCLIAKAVEVSAQKGHRYLVYGYWSDGSLSEFKRRCGFVPQAMPKYFVPLTWRGRLALRTGLHRGWTSLIPEPAMKVMKDVRRRWYDVRSQKNASSRK